MNKVLLVNTNIERAPYPVPPLGLCLLAESLKDRFNVRVYDGVFDEGKNLVPLVREFKPDYIGFSIRNIDDVVKDRTIFYVDDILKKFIRPVRTATDAPFILGGSGFSIFPDELMESTGADYGIAGEAESLLPELLERIEKKRDISDIPNLYTGKRKADANVGNSAGVRLLSQPFAEIDQWIDFQPYREKGVYSIQTKRGCAHRCIYCTYPLIEGRKFRPRDPSDIAEEICRVHERLGNITFEFVDSTFNDPLGHAEEVCHEIIRRNLKVRLRTMGINPRHTSEELFDLMVRAGFTQIDATPDSASPGMLKNLDKGFTRAEIERMARLILKFNLPTMWFFLFGGPGEDEGTFRETLDFIDEFISRDDLVYLNAGLRIYPGTPLHSIALKEGMIREDQSLFRPPVYYFSGRITRKRMDELIFVTSRSRHNCIPSAETAPPPEMVAEAIEMRRTLNLNEPIFRTLLRVREKWMSTGKI